MRTKASARNIRLVKLAPDTRFGSPVSTSGSDIPTDPQLAVRSKSGSKYTLRGAYPASGAVPESEPVALPCCGCGPGPGEGEATGAGGGAGAGPGDGDAPTTGDGPGFGTLRV